VPVGRSRNVELSGGEQLVLEGQPSWTTIGWPALAGVAGLGLLAALVVVAPTWPVALWWVLAALEGILILWIGARLWRRSRTSYQLTTWRLRCRRGLFGRTTVELLLSQIGEVEVRRSALDWLLRRGSVAVRAGGGEELVLAGLPRPRTWEAALRDALGAWRSAGALWPGGAGLPGPTRGPWTGEPTPPAGWVLPGPGAGASEPARPPAAPGDGRSVAERLRELQALYEEGLLTAAEFEAKRRSLLAEL
jgi:membrane protein YdbS with pleckstrin-like domain